MRLCAPKASAAAEQRDPHERADGVADDLQDGQEGDHLDHPEHAHCKSPPTASAPGPPRGRDRGDGAELRDQQSRPAWSGSAAGGPSSDGDHEDTATLIAGDQASTAASMGVHASQRPLTRAGPPLASRPCRRTPPASSNPGPSAGVLVFNTLVVVGAGRRGPGLGGQRHPRRHPSCRHPRRRGHLGVDHRGRRTVLPGQTTTTIDVSGDVEAKNYLIVGSDSRDCIDPGSPYAGAFLTEGNDIGDRSDTIMVLRVDPDESQAAILSFPRDLWVRIGSTNRKSRINSPSTSRIPAGWCRRSRRTSTSPSTTTSRSTSARSSTWSTPSAVKIRSSSRRGTGTPVSMSPSPAASAMSGDAASPTCARGTTSARRMAAGRRTPSTRGASAASRTSSSACCARRSTGERLALSCQAG